MQHQPLQSHPQKERKNKTPRYRTYRPLLIENGNTLDTASFSS